MPELRQSNPLKQVVADHVYQALAQLTAMSVGDHIDQITVVRLSELRTEVTVRRVASSPAPPRFFTVQVIEHR